MSTPRHVFIAATRQNDGKTMTSLGLFAAFQRRFASVGYIKPVGQQYRVIDGEMIDKDAVLIHSIYGLKDPLSWMSPVAVPRGFTTQYIDGGDRTALEDRIDRAWMNLSEGKDFVLIEGTGHAGVGSVFDLSNADVARRLGAKVVIVSRGGVGKPIDEILLNKALFDQAGVEVLGAIVNKVEPDRLERVTVTVRKGLARHGLDCFGVVPRVPLLGTPSVLELMEDLDARLLCGDDARLAQAIGKFVVGDKQPHDAIGALTESSLLITPGNREELILTALCGRILGTEAICNVSAIILTDGIRPHPTLLGLIEKSGIPVMLVDEDSFSVATRINNSIFKLRREETEKIRLTQELVERWVEVDRMIEAVGESPSPAGHVSRLSPRPQDPLAPTAEAAALIDQARTLLSVAVQREEGARRRERRALQLVGLLDGTYDLADAPDEDTWRIMAERLLVQSEAWLSSNDEPHEPDGDDSAAKRLERQREGLRQGLALARSIADVRRALQRAQSQRRLRGTEPDAAGTPSRDVLSVRVAELGAQLDALSARLRPRGAASPLRRAVEALRHGLETIPQI